MGLVSRIKKLLSREDLRSHNVQRQHSVQPKRPVHYTPRSVLVPLGPEDEMLIEGGVYASPHSLRFQGTKGRTSSWKVSGLPSPTYMLSSMKLVVESAAKYVNPLFSPKPEPEIGKLSRTTGSVTALVSAANSKRMSTARIYESTEQEIAPKKVNKRVPLKERIANADVEERVGIAAKIYGTRRDGDSQSDIETIAKRCCVSKYDLLATTYTQGIERREDEKLPVYEERRVAVTRLMSLGLGKEAIAKDLAYSPKTIAKDMMHIKVEKWYAEQCHVDFTEQTSKSVRKF